MNEQVTTNRVVLYRVIIFRLSGKKGHEPSVALNLTFNNGKVMVWQVI